MKSSSCFSKRIFFDAYHHFWFQAGVPKVMDLYYQRSFHKYILQRNRFIFLEGCDLQNLQNLGPGPSKGNCFAFTGFGDSYRLSKGGLNISGVSCKSLSCGAKF
jgi:hypothetical protein